MCLVWFHPQFKPGNQETKTMVSQNQTKPRTWFGAGFGFGLKPVKPKTKI
jgi:hypothetical protein